MEPLKEKIIELVTREKNMDLLDIILKLLAVEGGQ